MKKVLFILSIIMVLFTAVSCKDETPKATAGTPRLSGITWGSYDAFAVMRKTNSSRGISDGIDGGVNRLFGLSENILEKISINDDKGLEWACDEVKSIGKDFLLMGLSCAAEAGSTYKNYIVDKVDNKVIDLSFLTGDVKSELKNLNILTTAEGLFAKKDTSAVRIDTETKTMTPLTNPETDEVLGFYRFDNEIMFVKTIDWRYKFYPKDGVPIEYKDDIISGVIDSAVIGNPKSCLTSPELNIIVNLLSLKMIRITESGLSIESLDHPNPSYPYHSATQLYPEKSEGVQNLRKAIFYAGHTVGKIAVDDISTGSFVHKEYDAPKNLDRKNVAYSDGHLIYSTASGLYSLDLEAQTTETLVEGSLAKWQMATGRVIYTQYLSATDVETCFLNFATKEKETLSSSGVEVVSIASFVE